MLVTMTGYSGSGKSWLSKRLVPGLSAIRLRSDLERKRLAGLDPVADSQSGIASGLYDRATTNAVYDHLLEMAGELLRAGLNVILDASFLSASHRRLAMQAAKNSGAGYVLLRTSAAEAELRERLSDRMGRSTVSEADAAVLCHQFESADPLTEREMHAAITVDTEAQIDLPELTARIQRAAGE